MGETNREGNDPLASSSCVVLRSRCRRLSRAREGVNRDSSISQGVEENVKERQRASHYFFGIFFWAKAGKSKTNNVTELELYCMHKSRASFIFFHDFIFVIIMRRAWLQY